jgi:hypothetical protein
MYPFLIYIMLLYGIMVFGLFLFVCSLSSSICLTFCRWEKQEFIFLLFFSHLHYFYFRWWIMVCAEIEIKGGMNDVGGEWSRIEEWMNESNRFLSVVSKTKIFTGAIVNLRQKWYELKPFPFQSLLNYVKLRV